VLFVANYFVLVMLGAPTDHNHARPAKRPRNVSFAAEIEEESERGMDPRPRPEEAGPSRRPDEKNNRKLSCKECRRSAL